MGGCTNCVEADLKGGNKRLLHRGSSTSLPPPPSPMKAFALLLLVNAALCATDLTGVVKDAITKAVANVELMNDVATELGEDRTPQNQKPTAESIESQRNGDILQEATRLLVEAHGPAIFDDLSNIDIPAIVAEVQTSTKGRKKRYINEPIQTEPDNCIVKGACDSSFPFRSISGWCNHDNSDRAQGSTLAPLRRFMGSAKYDDGFNSVRSASAVGGSLPSARVVSNKIFSEAVIPAYDPKYSHMLQQFGQFIAHDVIFTPSSVGKNNAALDCTACNSAQVTPNCAPIEVPDGDTYFPSKVNGTRGCIRVTRAINGQTGLGPRAQINQNTHFLDLSVVYGSTDCQARELRTLSKGGMKMYTANSYTLPPQAANDSNCQSQPSFLCFQCGDIRNSLHPGLIPLHTIFLRQHNKWAAEIAAARPSWSDNSVYQETRRYMVALWQQIVYSEYLPKVIGTKMMSQFGLNPSGLRRNFDPRVNPSISAEFGTAAFRFGHSQIRKELPRTDNSNRTLGSYVDLGSNIFYADSLYDRTATVFNMAQGMVNYPAMAVDRQFSFPVRNQLFEIRNKKASGVDLPAVNIQRAREMGVHPYNDVRTKVGLRRITSFDELKADMDPANVDLLKKTYASVDDIDLYVGLLLEKPTDATALLGPTGSYLIADQFSAFKKGDRYFYDSLDNSGALTQAEYEALRNFPFAKFVCENTDGMANVQKDVFVFGAAKIACSSFKRFPMDQVLFA